MASSNFLLLCYFSMLLTNVFLLLQHPPVQAASAAQHLLINVTKQLYFPDFSLSNPRILHDIKLLGSAKFSKEKSAVEIPNESEAPDLRHLAGRALYSSPIRLLNPNTNTPASFETTFSFQFRNKTLSPGTGDGGSGLTFIIVPDELTVGRSGPWLGMLNDACEDDYKVVAVEFDTRYNPEFGDLNDNHVGINLGTIVSSKTINASDVGVFLKDGSVHRAWIRYDGSKRWLDIHLGLDSQELELPSKPLFSGSLDLSPFLKEYMFVGFSASTGNMTQIHNVLSWNFTSSSQASLRFPSSESCQTKLSFETETESAPTRTIKTEPTSSFMIFVAVVILCLIVLVSLYYNSKRKGQNSEAVIFEDGTYRHKPRRFTISEISSATGSFGEYEILGSDNRGTFYRGKLSNGSMVAVKRFSSRFLNSIGPDQRRMVKEIGAMSRVRHPNLVPIRGWCHDNSRETIVVYDFFPNGGLDQWVFGPGVLPWTRRFKVVKDMADALSFLHSKKLTHKNMKTTSVLLDINFRAVLGDYGFVLSGSQSKQFESTVSRAADVFEFGVFTLEVVCGRKRWDPEAGPEEKDLLELAWRMHEEGEKPKLVDRRMGSVFNMDQAIRVLELGLLCTVSESKGRPSMEKVVEVLSLDGPMPELPSNRPVALFPYSSATALCNSYACTPFK